MMEVPESPNPSAPVPEQANFPEGVRADDIRPSIEQCGEAYSEWIDVLVERETNIAVALDEAADRLRVYRQTLEGALATLRHVRDRIAGGELEDASTLLITIDATCCDSALTLFGPA